MEELKFRQVHLDFHTSEMIDNVGSEFKKEEFQAALKKGHVNSITVFSKCHHGWKYHPSKVGKMHPTLSFNLLEEQLKACKEIGVSAPIYISAGYDENYARSHYDQLIKRSPTEGPNFLTPMFHLLCFNTPYLDVLEAEVEEVMQMFNPEAIFLDISDVWPCYCPYCLESMRKAGLDPENPDDVLKQGEITYKKYADRMEAAVRKYNPNTRIFHNAGHIRRGRRDIANMDTHLEIESLPTAFWGYDHFPMSAAYAKTLGKEFLGMTGKFHRGWGEFGGFKHPNALRFETALSVALGAKCSIGDQLHPLGKMNMSTYSLIGSAYSEIEEKEPWLSKTTAVSDIAVLSSEAFAFDRLGRAEGEKPDTGASRILLEGKYLYDLIDEYTDFSNYKLLILPDVIRVDDVLAEKLKKYMAKGGKILASGESGLKTDKDEFALDFGIEYEGKNDYNPTYYRPSFETLLGSTEYLIYAPAYKVNTTTAEKIADMEQPFFNRAYNHFCSHIHTPNDPKNDRTAVAVTDNTAYVAYNIFEDYSQSGTYYVKELIVHLIEKLLGDEKTLKVDLPDKAVATLREQPDKNRSVLHLLYAHTTVRGNGVEVIEDVVPITDVSAEIKVKSKPQKVYLAPTGEALDFTFENGTIKFTVPRVYIHQMVAIEY